MEVIENSKVIDWELYDPMYKFLLVMETTKEVKTDRGIMSPSEFSWLLANDPRRDDGSFVIEGEINAMGGFGFGNGEVSINREIEYINALELHIRPILKSKINEYKINFAEV